MAEKKDKNQVSKLNFEQAIGELTKLVGSIEQGDIPLENSIKQYEKGMSLIKHCRQILKSAEERIKKISEQHSESETNG